jgi:hypothetical protein
MLAPLHPRKPDIRPRGSCVEPTFTSLPLCSPSTYQDHPALPHEGQLLMASQSSTLVLMPCPGGHWSEVNGLSPTSWHVVASPFMVPQSPCHIEGPSGRTTMTSFNSQKGLPPPSSYPLSSGTPSLLRYPFCPALAPQESPALISNPFLCHLVTPFLCGAGVPLLPLVSGIPSGARCKRWAQ